MSLQNLSYKPIMTLSIKAGEDIPKYRFVDYEGNIAGAGEKALGVTMFSYKANQTASTITLGTAIIETAGAISIGDIVTSDANGKAVVIDTDDEANGRALTACTAAGFITILIGN